MSLSVSLLTRFRNNQCWRLTVFDHNFRKYYKRHRYVGVFQFRQPKLLILDPTLVSDIYVKYFKHFSDNTFSDVVMFKQFLLLSVFDWIELMDLMIRLDMWQNRSTLQTKSIYWEIGTMERKALGIGTNLHNVEGYIFLNINLSMRISTCLYHNRC